MSGQTSGSADLQLIASISSDAGPGDASAIARIITEHAVDAIFLLDAEGRTTFANPAAEGMFGWTNDELRGERLHDLIHYQRPDGTPFAMCDCPLGQVFETGESLRFHEDVFFRRDGSAVHVTCSNAAVQKDGAVAGGVLIVRDVTERREAERHRKLLVGELNHRVKNMLAIVQGIAHQSFRAEKSGPGYKAFQGRLTALSAAHDLLTASDWRAASMRDVVRGAIRPFTRGEKQFALDGPEIELPPRIAVALAMAVHELATNATKYGALSAEGGRVTIGWESRDAGEGDRTLAFTWAETGGPAVEAPSRRGFGSRLIERSLASELGGSVSIEFRPEGLLCRVRAPLPNDA